MLISKQYSQFVRLLKSQGYSEERFAEALYKSNRYLFEEIKKCKIDRLIQVYIWRISKNPLLWRNYRDKMITKHPELKNHIVEEDVGSHYHKEIFLIVLNSKKEIVLKQLLDTINGLDPFSDYRFTQQNANLNMLKNLARLERDQRTANSANQARALDNSTRAALLQMKLAQMQSELNARATNSILGGLF